MARLSITNLNKRLNPDLNGIKKFALFVLKKLKFKKGYLVSIVFISNDGIKRLNREFKNKNRTTDILCFCTPFDVPVEGRKPCGAVDIYISSDKALVNARRYKTGFNYELKFYAAHGMLHVSGFDDSNIKRRSRMLAYQEELIRLYEKRQVSRQYK